MSARADALAARLAEVSGQAIEVIERIPDERWGATCEAEGWTVAATARHLTTAIGPEMAVARLLAGGQAAPGDWDALHARNAQRAEAYASAPRDETLDLLRRGRQEAIGFVQGLDDAELDRAAPLWLFDDRVASAQEFIERVLIGHIRGHLASIRATAGV